MKTVFDPVPPGLWGEKLGTAPAAPSSTPNLPKLPLSSQIEAKLGCRVKMRPGVESHQIALGLRSFWCLVLFVCQTRPHPLLSTSVLPSCPLILSVRVGEFDLQSMRARLLSSTLVSPVMFGYQCFIFINRDFSNIAIIYINK